MSQSRSLEQVQSTDWPEDHLATLVGSVFSSEGLQRHHSYAAAGG